MSIKADPPHCEQERRALVTVPHCAFLLDGSNKRKILIPGSLLQLATATEPYPGAIHNDCFRLQIGGRGREELFVVFPETGKDSRRYRDFCGWIPTKTAVSRGSTVLSNVYTSPFRNSCFTCVSTYLHSCRSRVQGEFGTRRE